LLDGQRQIAEWAGDEKNQAKGATKQAEGKLQNAWGKARDAVKKPGVSEERNRRAVNK
jgi:uncharacterized protein YjbJ (UPF0337 family)